MLLAIRITQCAYCGGRAACMPVVSSESLHTSPPTHHVDVWHPIIKVVMPHVGLISFSCEGRCCAGAAVNAERRWSGCGAKGRAAAVPVPNGAAAARPGEEAC
jgi:hypothetical protein